jgi:c-di-GMP-binding flagellar brake protein YcgR
MTLRPKVSRFKFSYRLYNVRQMVNRRQSLRVAYRQTVEVKLYSASGHPELKDRLYLGRTADVSEGGIGLRSETDIPIGTLVKLRIFVRDPPSAFTHQGVVRWLQNGHRETEKFLIGIEFAGGSPEHMEEWRRLVRHLVHEMDPGGS